MPNFNTFLTQKPCNLLAHNIKRYPFGMTIANRSISNNYYRYGFQGQEKDNEIYGEGNASFFKYRISDNRLGRFFAVDPLAKKYPHYSPYSFSGNKLIYARELEGLEEVLVTIRPVVGADPLLTQVNVQKIQSQVDHQTLSVTYNIFDANGNITTETLSNFKPGTTEQAMSNVVDANGNTRLATMTVAKNGVQLTTNPDGSVVRQDPAALTTSAPITAVNGFQYNLMIPFAPDGATLDVNGLAPTITSAVVQQQIKNAANTLNSTVTYQPIHGQGTAQMNLTNYNITIVGQTDGIGSNYISPNQLNQQANGNPALAQDRANNVAEALMPLLTTPRINTSINNNTGGANQKNRTINILLKK